MPYFVFIGKILRAFLLPIMAKFEMIQQLL